MNMFAITPRRGRQQMMWLRTTTAQTEWDEIELCQTTTVASAAADYLRFRFIYVWKIHRLNRNRK